MILIDLTLSLFPLLPEPGLQLLLLGLIEVLELGETFFRSLLNLLGLVFAPILLIFELFLKPLEVHLKLFLDLIQTAIFGHLVLFYLSTECLSLLFRILDSGLLFFSDAVRLRLMKFQA